MDWDKVKLPNEGIKRPRCGDLHPFDYWRLWLAGQEAGRSIPGILAMAVRIYLKLNWAEHEERLRIDAQNQGLSLEVYVRDLIDQELGTPLPTMTDSASHQSPDQHNAEPE